MYIRGMLRIVCFSISLFGAAVAMTVVPNQGIVASNVAQLDTTADASYEKEIDKLAEKNADCAERLRRTTAYYRKLYFDMPLASGMRDYIVNFIPEDDYLWEAEILKLAQTNLKHARLLAQTDLYYRALYFGTMQDDPRADVSVIPLYTNITSIVNDKVPQYHVETDHKDVEELAKTNLRNAQVVALINLYRRLYPEVVEVKEASKVAEAKDENRSAANAELIRDLEAQLQSLLALQQERLAQSQVTTASVVSVPLAAMAGSMSMQGSSEWKRQ